ncbi:hypothetical protein [Mastigocladopsis repens]|uniref:hypothetical protein n=1 Tax=Mastigocladopsis repens TaxID=221287 RepID=UPI000304B728|nr:hypothetical protein [Mastigocladopsis repens]
MASNSKPPDYAVSFSGEPKARRFLIPRFERRSFIFQFTFITILGWAVGGIASIAIEKTIVEVLPTAVLQQNIWYALAKYFSNSVFALIFGADQALILRRYLSGWLWMFATSLGWLIANGVSAQWINYIASIAASLNKNLSAEQAVIFGLLSTIAYILSGIWLGFFQWLVLRRYTTGAWWWNFLPSISFLFISILVWLLSLVQESIPAVNRPQVVYLCEQGLTALVLGVIPAMGLCTLKRKSRPI